jgi:hypothetical protein
MAVRAFASPLNLSWSHFRVTSSKIRDPVDGSLIDALTQFEFGLLNLPAEQVNGMFVPNSKEFLMVGPKNCQVWSGVAQTEKLLQHERFHYNVGFVIARACAHQLNATRAKTETELKQKIDAALQLHFETRNRLIQRRYDMDSKHGDLEFGEKIWRDRMKTCLADDHAESIGGFWL